MNLSVYTGMTITKGELMRLKIILTIFITGFLFLAGSSPAMADVYNFYNITNNDPSSLDVADQLSVEVEEAGGNVLFTFLNDPQGLYSSISEIYFYGNESCLTGNFSPSNKVNGVSFDTPAIPRDLPAWNSTLSRLFSTDADNPAPKKGINPGESFTIGYTGEFNDVIRYLDSGELIIGLHVISIDGNDGKSDSFVSQVPIPAAAWMFGAGLIGLVGIRRKLGK